MPIPSFLHYMPEGLTSSGTLDWNASMEWRQHSDAHLASEFPKAQEALTRYVADLERRFTFGGFYDTRILPTGEEFIEIVCGHPFDGRILCKVFSPILAVQLFADAVERYVVQGRVSGTIYWRTHPQMRDFTYHLKEFDEDMQRDHKWDETIYAIRARLLIL